MLNKNEYIFGIRAVMEAIEAGSNIDKVLLKKDFSGDLAKELLVMLKEYDIPVQRVPVERLNRITMKNHQGVIALLSAVPYYRLEDLIPQFYEEGRNPLIIVLDGITDTRNFGAIARTADCVGADAIVIPEKGSATVNADAVKTSAGALMSFPVCREKNIEKALRMLLENGYRVIGATEKGTIDYTAADYRNPTAIVMGAEDTGLSEASLRLCDDLVSIPIRGRIESLNVSVAAGVMMYEVLRQRTNE